MVNELDAMHGNTIVLLDRAEINLLVNNIDKTDSRSELAIEVFKRALELDKKHGITCINVPIKVSELKELFPEYIDHPPLWWKKAI